MSLEPEEYQLALRARAGDREALDLLVNRLRLSLFSLAYAEVRHYDDAQDVVAEALLRFCMHVGSLQEPGHLRSWVNSIVRNEARRKIATKSAAALHLATGPMQEPAVIGQPISSALRLDIEQALERLPRDHARAVALFYLAELPLLEIARRVGRPEGTVKYWLHQGRRELREVMKGYAPMSPTTGTTESAAAKQSPWIASILSTNITPLVLAQMVEAFQAAGWDKVHTLSNFTDAGRLEQSEEEGDSELPLPTALAGSRCVILDQWIDGRSAFELIPLLSATAERKQISLMLLADDPVGSPCHEIMVRAAYAAGVDALLSRPFDPAEFGRFGKHLRAALDTPSAAAL